MGDPNFTRLLPADRRRGPRLEIDEFIGDNEMTNLFLIAMSNLQQNSYKLVNNKPVWTNWYGIGGIHGIPSSDNWGGIKKVAGSSGGYCHHSRQTFPTWHRPYMSLLEQALYVEMVQQAELYTSNDDKVAYRAAAARFRMPYWDIVMPRNQQQGNATSTVFGWPKIFRAQKVWVKQPKPSSSASNGFDFIDNPLYTFNFPKEAPTGGRTAVSIPNGFSPVQTIRVPDASGKTNDAALELNIQRQAVSRATQVWQMLSPDYKTKNQQGTGQETLINLIRTWDTFSNNRGQPVRDQNDNFYDSLSLESFHDGIHVLLGTGTRDAGSRGHMGSTSVAGFDPIFYMHHNNIDRLLALFQALYPDKYFDGNVDLTPLPPFINEKGGQNLYDSNATLVKDYWSPGFATPGDAPLPQGTDQAAFKRAITKYLSDTYFWATNGGSPTASLPSWPKLENVKASWALSVNAPKPAAAVSAPTFQVSALTFQKNVPMLVSRSLAVEPDKSFEVQDTTIHTAQIVEKTDAVNALLPPGAFLDAPPSAPKSQPATQVTWNAKVTVRKFAFNHSFSVHLFIGWVKDDQPERFMTKKNEVGFQGVFTGEEDGAADCANCQSQRQEDIYVTDRVPMTTILYDYLDGSEGSENLIRDGQIKTIPDLTPGSVVPFLREQLKWRMIDLGATLLEGQEQQSGLQVTITSREFTPPTPDNLMGVYGPETIWPEITNDKPGGLGYAYPS